MVCSQVAKWSEDVHGATEMKILKKYKETMTQEV